jgi:cellulose synthase/poly-beta-1,6-N-acetylglucosamine synthase-like glycosyltransferase
MSLFFSLYFEVFLLITYFEKRIEIKLETFNLGKKIKKYLSAVVIVPCWNEEKTLAKTVNSLLKLDYPKNKLKIIIVDDGSTDNTWREAKHFEGNSQIEIYHKENGGKHSAVNFGIEKAFQSPNVEIIGCLDADSFVHKDALKNIVHYFQSDKKVMSVTPSIKVWKPKGVIQHIQNVEYGWGIFTRKMFSYLEAMYVTPGPLSMFRREVFEKLGGYQYAHQTEDSEMALRLQKNHYKIINAHDAVVYTVVPDTLKKLYKQRLRWTYGFIKNSLDYRFLFFKKEYGNLGLLVLPMAGLSILTAIYIISISLYNLVYKLLIEAERIRTVGFDFGHISWNLDWFSFNTEFLAVLSILAFSGTITIILISRRMAEGRLRLGRDLIYFLTLYTFIAPLWLGKAVFNALFSVKAKWR